MGAHSPPRGDYSSRESNDGEHRPFIDSPRSCFTKRQRRCTHCRLSSKVILTIASCLLIALYCGYIYYAPSNNVNDNTNHYIETAEIYVKKKKKTQLDGHHSTCDCYSGNNDDDYVGPGCCERIIFRAHKFGTILVGDLFEQFRHARTRFKIRTKDFPPPDDKYELSKRANDYRHVVVTRNWKDAIVSGYLYHKAGYECWINFRGETGEDSVRAPYRSFQWFSHLPFYSPYYRTYTAPRQHNRSLCQYLVDESEEDGMKVIMDIALSRWYKGVVPYYNKVQERLKIDARHRTHFLCFEDLVNPFRQEKLFRGIVEFMFPGRNHSSIMDMPYRFKESLEQQKQSHSVYSGAHASTHDPAVRARLKGLVDKYDREIFNNTVAKSSALFGCGGKI